MNNSGMRRKEVYNRTVDLYAILGLDKGASAGQISKAYKSLAKRYHPDRSVGNDKDENTEKFKKICEAYSILSDQRRRRQYDVYGGNPSEMEDSAYEMEGQNSITRVFGAVWSAFGAVLHTEIGASTLIQAQELCARSAAAAAAAAAAAVSGGEEGKPSTTKINEANKEGKKVTELKLGHGITGSTGRQDSVYYVLRLSEAEAANGVIVSCNSSNKSRFKLICFDHEGAVRYVQESSLTSDKKFTVANMFLVPFETIISVAPPPVGGGLLDHPQIFERVRNMTAEARTLRAGEHLLCVYGDNWLNNTPYTLTALLAELSSGVVQAVKDVDAELREKKKEVEELEDEYIRAKMVFDRVSDRVAEQTAVTEGLINKREVAFNIFIEESLRKYSNKHVGLGGRLPTAAAVPAAAMPVANMALDTPQGVEVAGGKAEHQRAGSLTSSNSDGATVGASEIGQDVKESVPPATGGKGGGKERVKGATAAGENIILGVLSMDQSNKMKKPSLSSWCLVAAVIALAGCLRKSQAFNILSLSPSALSSRLPRAPATEFSPCFRTSTALHGSSLPPDIPSPTGENSRRRQSRFNKTPKQPEEPKKEARFSKDSHFYTGAIGIGTYSWGDRRDGFFYGDYPSNAMERSQMSCGAFNEQDIEEAFTFLEEAGLPMFDARELYPCEDFLGEMVNHWKKRQLKLQSDVKQVRPFIATNYQARLFGKGLLDVRGGRRAVLKALEGSLEALQATRVDLYQITKPGPLYWGGEKAIFEAVAQAKRMRLLDNVGVVGYVNEDDLRRVKTTAKSFGIDIKSNSFELSLANPAAALVDGTVAACKNMNIVPFANRPLAGGLAAGTYTMMDPSGGRSRKPRYTFPDLEPLYPIHKALREHAGKYTEKLGKRVNTAQVSINWVRAQGVIPLVGVKTAAQAKDMVEAAKWDLEPEDVKELSQVALDTYKKRRKITEMLAKARR